jgi:hypothetical protein
MTLQKPLYEVGSPDILPERVFVYRNLRRRLPSGAPVWSVKDPKTGLVVAHVETIHLTDVSFKVSERGRQRVLDTKQKNVHAGLVGCPTAEPSAGNAQALYDPYKYSSFVDKTTGDPVLFADTATITSNGVNYRPAATSSSK